MPTTRRHSLAPARRLAAKAVSGTLDQTVYDGLFDAVMQGRLKPGARLGEAALCDQFGVSRTVVRQALRRLAEAQVVEIVPNKGATVAAPTPQETREVFVARRAIEAAIVRQVAQRLSHGDVQRLHERLQAEHAALHQGDHARWVTLAGGFHLALAQLAGNRVLQRMLPSRLRTRRARAHRRAARAARRRRRRGADGAAPDRPRGPAGAAGLSAHPRCRRTAIGQCIHFCCTTKSLFLNDLS
jgi:DNA-binding GntR family transcriptional regulator